ncbi:right-handed parallel beta-helix repeat-containing protein [Roseivirga sp. BDSF3-8]|uniref:right-handed parallel beta-helix repeat-containing protein n=1 Tax=Roseivirga sp. BDSF3-8 TaxID=3241598 RepID=UPI0035327E31
MALKGKVKGLIFLTILAICWACEPFDEQIITSGDARLNFSQDSVRFDTLFTSVGSISRRFKVYNPNENAVSIAQIALGKGQDSPYRISVNGERGYSFEDQLLFGNDSLLILVDITIDPRDETLPFLVKDSVVFTTNKNLQDVKLEAFGQDAIFLGNEILTCNDTWTAQKPYVLFGPVLVDSLCTLTIEKGAQIYADNGAALFIQGNLRVQGDSANTVVFRNSRLDEGFDNAPGQWGGLIFLEGSRDNHIEYASIRNSVVGVNLTTYDEDTIPDLIMRQVVIENISLSGILTLDSDVYAENTLVNTCGEFLIANLGGGNYQYYHCTFANYNYLFSREVPAVVFSDNGLANSGENIVNPLNVVLENSIVWGRGFNGDEVVIDSTAGEPKSFRLSHNLIKAQGEIFEGNDNLLNTEPGFADPIRYLFQPDTLSPLINNGIESDIIIDLNGNPRDAMPDIGAYEYNN